MRDTVQGLLCTGWVGGQKVADKFPGAGEGEAAGAPYGIAGLLGAYGTRASHRRAEWRTSGVGWPGW